MNQSYVLAAGALALSASLALTQEPMPKQSAQSLKQELRTTVQAKYLLYLPPAYDAPARKRWPLLLFLHGIGERGTNLNKVKIHGPPKLIAQGTNFPFIVVSPQCPLGQWWDEATLEALLDEVTEQHQVDPKRVYLTGLSMGGFGAFALALRSPERFAAVAPICGGGNPFPPHGYDASRAAALKSLPFWVFHGSHDASVPLAESERMVKALERFGGQVKFTVYPGVGHDAWTQTYANPELYAWLLEHQR